VFGHVDIPTSVPGGRAVPSRANFPDAQALLRLARCIGAGRGALGGAFLGAPAWAMRILGVDPGTAQRIVFLTRMTAARDLGLGMGTLAAGRAASPWLLAGAFADAVDAIVIAAALRRGPARGVVAVGAVAAAVGGAASSVLLARALRRR
jgi:hypothetical protein